MGLEQITVIKITCVNPKCPGHPNLDDKDRTGWLFMNFEVYGQPTQQGVFGSTDCVSQAAADAPIKPPDEIGPKQVFAGIDPGQSMLSMAAPSEAITAP